MDTTNNIIQTNVNRNLLFTNYKYNTRKKIRNLCKCLRSSAKRRPPHSVIAADRKPFPFAGQKIFCHCVMDMVYTSNVLSSIFISFNRRAKKIAQCWQLHWNALLCVAKSAPFSATWRGSFKRMPLSYPKSAMRHIPVTYPMKEQMYLQKTRPSFLQIF